MIEIGGRVRIGTNQYDFCVCGDRKVVSARTCRACMRQANARPVVVNDVVYESLGRAAVSLNISEQLVRYRCKSNGFPEYYYKWRENK